MRKVLIPIDGTKRSLKSVELVKSLYRPADVEITLLMVRDDIVSAASLQMLEEAKAARKSALTGIEEALAGYSVESLVFIGNPAEEILACAAQMQSEIIIMTKSTRRGWLQRIGSVTSQVVKKAHCIVMIVPENPKTEKAFYFSSVCKNLTDTITLSPQLSFQPSSCLLPVQPGECRYTFQVLAGKMQLNHTCYNEDSGIWDALPHTPQQKKECRR